jgi:mono/diheme cytochrome c family protein
MVVPSSEPRNVALALAERSERRCAQVATLDGMLGGDKMRATRPGGAPLGVLVLAVLLVPAAALADEKPRYDAAAAAMGEVTYKTYCASCHGTKAEGDGPLAPHLGTRPSDLTTLSKRNEGKYPFTKVYHVIDGRRPVKAHGAMPAWADAFRESREGNDDDKVREKITQLTEFLASIQKESSPKTGTALALCVFSNPGFSGKCTESADLPEGSSARQACEAILSCLSGSTCIKTYCGGTTIRQGWRLESVRVVTAQP